MKAAFAEGDLTAALEAKTEFNAVLIGGCQERFRRANAQAPARPHHAVAHHLDVAIRKRINKSLREVTAIWCAIQLGEEDLAEQCCFHHIKAAAVAALSMIEQAFVFSVKGSQPTTKSAPVSG